MLVKIKRTTNGRWIVQALQGPFYAQEIAIVDKVYLKWAKLGTVHITGHIYGSWGVDVIKDIIGTKTEDFLMVKDNQATPKLVKRMTNENGRWLDSLGGLIPEATGGSIQHLLAGEQIEYDNSTLRSPLVNVVSRSPEPKKEGIASKMSFWRK